MQIQDGKGRGFLAAVNAMQRMLVEAVCEQKAGQVSREDGEAYVAHVTDTGPAAGEYPFYLKNTDDDKVLVIDKVFLSAEDGDVQWILHHVTGTAAGASEVTPVNLNLASGHGANATCRGGAGGVTGLTSESVLGRFMGGATGMAVVKVEYDGALVLGDGDAVALEYQAGTGGDADITVTFHYE
jgi:hypothetical protein